MRLTNIKNNKELKINEKNNNKKSNLARFAFIFSR